MIGMKGKQFRTRKCLGRYKHAESKQRLSGRESSEATGAGMSWVWPEEADQ